MGTPTPFHHWVAAMSVANDSNSEKLDAADDKWLAKYEKQKQAGWVHSMCLKCFRKRWPHG